MSKDELKQAWGKWPDLLHELPEQWESIAKSMELKKFVVNMEKGSMEVVSTTRNRNSGEFPVYQTTLENCTCSDFIINKKQKAPCKHMYKLAHECGFRNFSMEQQALFNNVIGKCKLLNSEELKQLSIIIDQKFEKVIQKTIS